MLCVAVLLGSCKKSEPTGSDSQGEQQFGEETVLGKKRVNPYSIENMRAVCKTDIKPNCYYLRFAPKNAEEVNLLQQTDFVFFDYPLNYEINTYGKHYNDPSKPDDVIAWVYTVIPDISNLPDVEHTILEECYIPNDENLEREAYIHAGYELPNEDKQAVRSNSRHTITGTIRVKEDTGKASGLKGVKVIARTDTKVLWCHTDDVGGFTINGFFLENPEYSIVYDNIDGFSVWKDFSFIDAAVQSLGTQEKTGYNYDLEPSNYWYWCLGVINNAAFDYYNFCHENDILTPPEELKIWDWSFTGSSSASMIRRLSGFEGGTITYLAGKLIDFLSGSYTLYWVKDALPDLTIGTSGTNTYGSLYTTTWHELTHSSHYSKAGKDVWAPYIDYIVANQGYGEKGTTESVGKNVCDLGESWAYANERYRYKERFGVDATNTLSDSQWFYEHYMSIYNVLDKGILTRQEMYACLLPEVTSYRQFVTALESKYSGRSKQIAAEME